MLEMCNLGVRYVNRQIIYVYQRKHGMAGQYNTSEVILTSKAN